MGIKIPEKLLVERITLKSILDGILAQFNLEKGLGYTIKKMTLAPGKAVQEYLFEDRTRLTKPLTFVLLVVAIATFLSLRFMPPEALVQKQVMNSSVPPSLQAAVILFLKLSKQYFNILLMSSLPALSLGSYLIFREKGLHYAEHLVLNMYVFAMQTLIQLPFMPFFTIAPWLAVLMVFVNVAYYLYAFAAIFQVSWRAVIPKAIAIYLITQFVQSILFGILLFFIWLFA